MNESAGLEDSMASPRTRSGFRERPRGDQLKADERKSAIGLSIQGSASQSSQPRAEKQTSVSVDDAERMNFSEYPQRLFKKDATSRHLLRLLFELLTKDEPAKSRRTHIDMVVSCRDRVDPS